MLLPDKLLSFDKKRIHKNPNYKRVRLFVQDKQIFNKQHSSDIRLAGQYYRKGIKGGEYEAGDRELIFNFLLHKTISLAELNKLISSVHKEILLTQKVSVSTNIVGCAIMELLMDDTLDNLVVVSDYIKVANRLKPNHVWRFSTPEEYEKYHIDMVEEHHNGVPVAFYQLEKDIRYYEWMQDVNLDAAREWVKKRYNENLYNIVECMQTYKVPVYLLAYQRHGVPSDTAVICGRVSPNGDISIGKEIPRKLFAEINKKD